MKNNELNSFVSKKINFYLGLGYVLNVDNNFGSFESSVSYKLEKVDDYIYSLVCLLIYFNSDKSYDVVIIKDGDIVEEVNIKEDLKAA